MGQRSCKKSNNKNYELHEATIQRICEATKLTREEIVQWHKGFIVLYKLNFFK